MEGVGVAGARSFAPPEGEGKVHARDGQTVSLTVSQSGTGAQKMRVDAIERVVVEDRDGISWQYLARPGGITQSNHRPLEACGRLQSTMPLWAMVSG